MADLSGCVHWWDGPNVDSSAVLDHALSGAINATLVAGPSFADDTPGSVIILNGSTQWAVAASTIDVGTGDVSFFGWVKTSTDGRVAFCQGSNGTTPGFYLYDTGTTLEIGLNSGGGNYKTWDLTSHNISDGSWHSIGFSKSGANIPTLYVDGDPHTPTQVGTGGTYSGNIYSTAPFYLGRYDSAGLSVNGRIGPAGLWKRVLDDAAFASLHAGARMHNYAQTVEDACGLTDAFPSVFTASRAIADAEGVTDLASSLAGYIRSLTDAEGVSDLVSQVSTAIRTILDNEGLSDLVAKTSTFSRSISDSEGMADLLVKASVFSRSLSDSEGMTDNVIRVVESIRTVLDSEGMTDAVTSEFILGFLAAWYVALRRQR